MRIAAYDYVGGFAQFFELLELRRFRGISRASGYHLGEIFR